MTTQSKPPPKEEMDKARKELEEACAAIPEASKKHGDAVEGLKKTISNPKLQAVRAPTPSQMDLETPAPKR